MSNLVRLAVEYFPDDDKGKPVGGGSIYVGLTDTDPEVVGNQKQIEALQEDGSFVNMTQPVTLSAGGVPLYNGSPVSLYVKGDYSLKVLDAQGSQIYYVPSYYYVEEGALTPGNYYYPDSSAADHGVVGDSNTIKYYVDLIGSDEATLYFRHDSGNQWTDYALLTSETIPSNIKLEFENGARISINSGVTFTIDGYVDAGLFQIFTGSGTVAGDPINDGVYPHWWYSSSWGTAIQAAQDFCYAATPTTGRQVTLLPPGDYELGNTTINYKAPIIGQSASVKNGPVLKTTISDGSAVIQTTDTDFVHLAGFTITASVYHVLTNAIGINLLYSSSRYFIDNVLVQYVTTGFVLEGWIGKVVNGWATNCTTGVIATSSNGSQMHWNIEDCTTGLKFEGAGATLFVQVEGCTSGVEIDNSYGINIDIVAEANTTHLTVGGTSACYGISLGGKLVGDSAEIIINNVRGFLMDNCYIGSKIRVSNLASELDFNYSLYQSTDLISGYVSDDSESITPFYNFFPNPDFNGGLRGAFGSAALTRVTVAEESTIVRNSGSALRLTQAAGDNFSYLTLDLTSEAVARFKGKEIALSCWMYIPDITGYSTYGSLFPEMTIKDDVGESNSQQQAFQAGSWNLMDRKFTVDAAATFIQVRFFPNRSGNTIASDAYVIVSEVIVTDVANTNKLICRQWIPHWLSGRWDGPAYVGYGTAAPTDTDFTFKVGDRWTNTAPSVDGNNMVLNHWVCTVAGSPGTWTPQYYSTVTPAT